MKMAKITTKQKRYNQSEEGKAAGKRYRRTEKGKATLQRASKRYRNSKKGKTWRQQYRQSENGKNRIKSKYLKHMYDITLEEYNCMFAKQTGCCVICGIHQSELKKALAVDHNRETGKIRELLCPNCNAGIGMLKHNPNYLRMAAEYLEKHSE